MKQSTEVRLFWFTYAILVSLILWVCVRWLTSDPECGSLPTSEVAEPYESRAWSYVYEYA